MRLCTLRLNGRETAAVATEHGVVPVARINAYLGRAWPTDLYALLQQGLTLNLLRDAQRTPDALPPSAADYAPLYRHPRKIWGICPICPKESGMYPTIIFGPNLRVVRSPSSRLRTVASGLTTFQAYRYVILPVALRIIIPPGTSESLNLLKNSSVALTISVAELTFQTRQIETYTAKAIEALTAGTLIYLVLCVSLASIMSWVERRTAIPGLIVGGRQRR